MLKPSLIRSQLAALVGELKFSVQLLTRLGACALGLVVLTLLPLMIFLWELAL